MPLPTQRVYALTILALFVLHGCNQSNVRTQAGSIVSEQAWQERQILLSKSSQWNVSGRIAMQTSDDAWSASLNWKQSGNHYNIQLFGPFGGKALSINGSDNYVFLTTDKGETFSESNAAQLIYRQTGWRVPVDGLRYWSRALAAPEIPAEKRFDQTGRLSELHQSDWVIFYDDYLLVDDTEMPRKIRLENANFTVKLILRDWHLSPVRRDT